MELCSLEVLLWEKTDLSQSDTLHWKDFVKKKLVLISTKHEENYTGIILS